MSTRRKGKCHRCGEGQRARDCRAPKAEPATAPAAQEPSGAPELPETSPTDATHAADFEVECCSLAEEGVTQV